VANSLSHVSSEELLKKLTAFAVMVFGEFGFLGGEALLPGIGKSPLDYAERIFVDYVMGRIRAKELAYLCHAVRNDIIDDLRSPAQKRTELRSNLPQNRQNDDGPRPPAMDDLRASNPTVEDVLDEETYKARVRRCVEDEPDLKEIVEAVFDLNLTKPTDIASALDITSAAVQARRKKLRRRLITSGIVQVKK